MKVEVNDETEEDDVTPLTFHSNRLLLLVAGCFISVFLHFQLNWVPIKRIVASLGGVDGPIGLPYWL